MTQPVFFFQGNETTAMDAIEFVNPINIPVIATTAGTTLTCGGIKIETGVYDAVGGAIGNKFLFNLQNCHATFSRVRVDAVFGDTTGAAQGIFVVQGAVGSEVDVNHLMLLTEQTNLCFICYGTADYYIRKISNDDFNGHTLTHVGSAATADTTVIASFMQPQPVILGDEDYTCTVEGPNVIIYNAELTAHRSVILPSPAHPCNAFNGKFIRIYRKAATPGAFSLIIKNYAGGELGRIADSTNGLFELIYKRPNWIIVKDE
jgi:hypothetical protein